MYFCEGQHLYHHGLLRVIRHFSRTYHLCHHCRKVSTPWCILRDAPLLGVLSNPEDGGDMLLQNVGWLYSHYIPDDKTLQAQLYKYHYYCLNYMGLVIEIPVDRYLVL
jgi:hypothetical protein